MAKSIPKLKEYKGSLGAKLKSIGTCRMWASCRSESGSKKEIKVKVKIFPPAECWLLVGVKVEVRKKNSESENYSTCRRWASCRSERKSKRKKVKVKKNI